MTQVSVITPSYNSANYIGKTIQSVIDQSYSDWEMIIVDDCSTDDTVDVVNEFSNKDSRVKLVQLRENSGAAVARNTAIESAKGRYIAFLDSDDLWLPDKLDRQIRFMQQTGCEFSYSAYNKIDENGGFLGRVGVPESVSYGDLLKVCSIGCLTAVYDAEKLGKIYMPMIRKRQDLGLWLEILKRVPCALGLQDSLGQYRVRKDSISANKRVAACYTWKLYREVEHLNFFKAAYYFSHYAANGFLRTKIPRLARLLGVLK